MAKSEQWWALYVNGERAETTRSRKVRNRWLTHDLGRVVECWSIGGNFSEETIYQTADVSRTVANDACS